MKLRLPCILLAFTSAAFAQLPPLDYTVGGTYSWTENLGRASGKSDFRDTSVLAANVTVGASKQLSSGLTGRLQFEAGTLAVPDYELADESSAGLRGILRHKFGLGPEAPVLSVEAATLGRLARIDERDALVLQGSVTLSKRFNSVVSAQVRGDWQEHVADANTFDVHHYGIEGRLAIDPTERLRFSVGGGYLDGTFTAGASAARFAGALAGSLGPDVAAYYAGVPRTVTGAFGPNWVAYRVEGDVDYFFLEFSPAITDRLSLTVRYERNHAVNIVDVDYRQDIFSVAAIYAF